MSLPQLASFLPLFVILIKAFQIWEINVNLSSIFLWNIQTVKVVTGGFGAIKSYLLPG
jgi:hypothetical protein